MSRDVLFPLVTYAELNYSRRDGGVVGLAVARALLQRFPDRSTVLVERHTRSGEETR